MNYTAEQINNAFANLSPEKNRAMCEIDIDSIVDEVSKKYKLSQEISDSLNLYTTFVVVNLMTVDDFSKLLAGELLLSEDLAKNIYSDINQMIFVVIDEHIQNIKKEEEFLSQIKLLVFDPSFGNMPQDVQEAIAQSNWRENLYTIAQKHKLTIEQMGILEDITIKVMLGTINPDKYEAELSSKTTIAKEEMSDLVTEVNEGILIKIRELFKRDLESKENEQKVVSSEDDEIPLPPYATPIKKIEPEIRKEEETPKIIEVPKTPEPVIKTIQFPIKKDQSVMPAMPAHEGQTEEIKKIEKPIEPVVKNFDLPNINKNIQIPLPPKINNPSSLKHDPYREEF